MTTATHSIPPSVRVSQAFEKAFASDQPEHSGRCIKPATVGGQLRPCRTCSACAYATALRKAALLRQELDPVRPSYFVTLTYNRDAYQKLMLPPKPEGELTSGQEHQRHKWQRRIFLLGERIRDTPPGPQRVSLEKRLQYRQERLDTFMERCLRPLGLRPSIRREDGKLWQKRMLELLQLSEPQARLPRMVLKFERGSHGSRRPHIHVLMLHPSPHELAAAVESWGHLFADKAMLTAWRNASALPPFPTWAAYLKPRGRGHVHILPVDTEGVSTYVTKDLYRGQDATALEYIAQGVEPPSIKWPRNPGIGCGGWLDYLTERYVEWREVYQLSDVELELVLQDTRNRRTSLRHRIEKVVPPFTRLADGRITGQVPVISYLSCPPTVWRKFLAMLEPERDRQAQQLVTDALAARNAATDSDPGRELKRRHTALQAAEKRLRNWSALCAQKAVDFPTYVERERAWLQRRAVELRGGQIAAAVVDDVDP